MGQLLPFSNSLLPSISSRVLKDTSSTATFFNTYKQLLATALNNKVLIMHNTCFPGKQQITSPTNDTGVEVFLSTTNISGILSIASDLVSIGYIRNDHTVQFSANGTSNLHLQGGSLVRIAFK